VTFLLTQTCQAYNLLHDPGQQEVADDYSGQEIVQKGDTGKKHSTFLRSCDKTYRSSSILYFTTDTGKSTADS
jgi:hypothetical protein